MLLPMQTIADDFSDQAKNNWHQWRGPLANGTTPSGDPPTQWSETKNIKWKASLPGEGSATPIIWEDRVFAVAAVRTDRLAPAPPAADPRAKTRPPANIYKFVVLCLDRVTGEREWQTTVCEDVPHEGRHSTNTYASSSPMTDGERLFVSFGSRGIYCLDLNGKILWKRDLGNMRTRYGWGEATSPVVHGESVIINWDHEDQSFITALDAKSGDTRWKVERDEPSSWATPLVVSYKGRTQVIANGTNRVRSYELADGKLIWECGGQTVNAIPSPVLVDDFVVCMSGYRGSATYAIPLDATGDVTGTDRIMWTHNEGTPYVPSATVVDGRVYFTQRNSAILHCLNVKTGERIFGPERLPGMSNVYASPVAAAGRIYFVGRDGNAVVIEAADSMNVLATSNLDVPIDASPAICGRQLFIRSAKTLYCIAAD